MTKLSIVIAAFNKWNFTRSTLKNLSYLPADHEVIVVDNASSDETVKELPALVAELNAKEDVACQFHYIRNEENLFHSKACNQGYRMSQGENVLFLNNDLKFKSNHMIWTEKVLDGIQKAGDAILGPTMGQLDNKLDFVQEIADQLNGKSYVGGWCVAASRKVWDKLDVDGTGQVWNEAFPFYFNDTDLSFRARKLGIEPTFCPVTDLVHFGKVSAQQINIPKLYKEGRAVFLKHWSNK